MRVFLYLALLAAAASVAVAAGGWRNGGGDRGGGRSRRSRRGRNETAPSFTTYEEVDPVQMKVSAAHWITLDCRAKGRPRARLRWFKDGEELTADTDRQFDPYQFERWKLVIKNARFANYTFVSHCSTC